MLCICYVPVTSWDLTVTIPLNCPHDIVEGYWNLQLLGEVRAGTGGAKEFSQGHIM